MPNAKPSDPLPTIADLQRELARCRAERDEALAQQTATAEVLQVINASPGDLAPVFDAILEKATELCDAAFGNLWTYDGERFQSMAHRGAPPPLVEFLRHPQRPGPGTTLGEIQRGAAIVHFPDASSGEAYRSGDAFAADSSNSGAPAPFSAFRC